MGSSDEHSDWLDDAFDDEKNAQIEEELQRARSKSRIAVIVLIVIIAIVVLVAFASCGAISMLSSSYPL